MHLKTRSPVCNPRCAVDHRGSEMGSLLARLRVGPYQLSAKMIRLNVLAITFLLQALRSEGYAYKMTSTHCSRSIASGTIMGQSIQESAVASIRLVKGGSAIACGGTLTPGDTGLTFSLSGQSGQYVIEASASAGTSSSWGIINGGCSMKRDTSTSKTFTVPNDGTVTVRATWATGYGSAVYKTPDCTYTVQSAASCSSNQYLSGSSCAACEGCPAGQYRKDCGGSSAGTCQACASGTYETSTGSQACTTCVIGKNKTLLVPSLVASQGPVPTRAITMYIPQGVRDEGGIKRECIAGERGPSPSFEAKGH